MPRFTERKSINYRREAKCLWPKLRKKKNKKYHRELKDKGLLHHFDYYSKTCPICGKTRRSGYIESCKDCRWIIEYRSRVQHYVERLNASIIYEGYRIDYHFNRYFITIILNKTYPSRFTTEDDVSRIKFMIASANRIVNIHSVSKSEKSFETYWKELIEYLKESVDNFVNDNKEYQKVISKFPTLKNMSLEFFEALNKRLKIKEVFRPLDESITKPVKYNR